MKTQDKPEGILGDLLTKDYSKKYHPAECTTCLVLFLMYKSVPQTDSLLHHVWHNPSAINLAMWEKPDCWVLRWTGAFPQGLSALSTGDSWLMASSWRFHEASVKGPWTLACPASNVGTCLIPNTEICRRGTSNFPLNLHIFNDWLNKKSLS